MFSKVDETFFKNSFQKDYFVLIIRLYLCKQSENTMTMINDELAEKLKEVSPMVTVEDRKEACAKFLKSRFTIFKYLAGEVRNADFGLELLEFFHGRIADRAERLKAIA